MANAELFRLAYPARASLCESGRLTLGRFDHTHEFGDISGQTFLHVCQQMAEPFDFSAWKTKHPGLKSDGEQFLAYCLNERLIAPCLDNFVVPGATFRLFLDNLYKQLNEEIFCHQLWQSLSNGTASDHLVRGWVRETFFFIYGANVRMTTAISHCASNRVRKILSKHYKEEWDHYKFFAQSLASLDLDVEKVVAAGPILGTRAVMWAAQRIARRHELAYVACSGLLESTGTDSARGRAFYSAVQSHYVHMSLDFIDPMLKHVDLDEEYAHGSVTSEVFDPLDQLHAHEIKLILKSVEEFKDTLVLWFDEIVRHYCKA